jgi:hypothetical protein
MTEHLHVFSRVIEFPRLKVDAIIPVVLPLLVIILTWLYPSIEIAKEMAGSCCRRQCHQQAVGGHVSLGIII